jgi:hypothetical protein
MLWWSISIFWCLDCSRRRNSKPIQGKIGHRISMKRPQTKLAALVAGDKSTSQIKKWQDASDSEFEWAEENVVQSKWKIGGSNGDRIRSTGRLRQAATPA